MPTNFRWLWYLVGLAGMALAVVGILAMIGSAADIGILIPLALVVAIVGGYALVRFRRSLDAALAAAPSRQPDAAPSSPDAGAKPPTDAEPRPDGDTAAAAQSPKPNAKPGRTSRR
jgi:hypothetical protein